MATNKTMQLGCVMLCIISLLFGQTIARAEIIGAEEFLSVVDRRDALDRVEAVLAREEVQRELKLHGVDPAEASARASALNDQELLALADNLENLPAGGSVLGIFGIVFIVLLILELVGVIDIFKKI